MRQTNAMNEETTGDDAGVRRMRRWLRLAAFAVAVVSLSSALPTLGQGPTAAALDRASAARAAYGLPTGRDRVRQVMAATDSAASAAYGFPLTRAEHHELMARTAYARRFGKRTLPWVERLAGYGGTWLDQRRDGQIVVALTQVTPAARRGVRARLPKAGRGVRFVNVDDSAASLERALQRADRDWAALGTGIRPQAFAISHRHNRLVVKVRPAQLAAARQAVPRMVRRARVDVAIEASGRVTDSACRSRQRCFGPLRLGARMNHDAVYRTRSPRSQWNCAVGFMLSDKTILTAGHCAYRHRGPWHGHAAYRARFGRIGYVKSSLYTSKHRDLARIKLEDWRANRSTRIFGDAWPATLTAAGQVIDNMDVCVSLARQNRLWCGRVTEPVARWRSSTAGIWVWGAGMRFNAPGRTSLPGDSGSPVVAAAQDCPTCRPRRIPIGIVNAGNEADGHTDSPGGRINADLYFAKVAWALEDAEAWPQLDIYTGPPPPPEPSPSPEPSLPPPEEP